MCLGKIPVYGTRTAGMHAVVTTKHANGPLYVCVQLGCDEHLTLAGQISECCLSHRYVSYVRTDTFFTL
jgi:hypothetical protein